ncbi:MAG: transposase [Dorea sp.]|nr:transposase [Dorea sp.]
MPRHARTFSSTNIYHVVIKGADHQLLFEENKDYRKYLEFLSYYKEQLNFELFAYCLMDNHVHLLIRHPENISLESIFRRLNTSYASWFNFKYQRTGFVQDGRYFSDPVETRRHLLNVVRYIHFNPTKAGLEEYPGKAHVWSSFSDYLDDAEHLTDTQFVLELLGSIEEFTNLHSAEPDDELDINAARKRIPDEAALEIIKEICNLTSVLDFQKLSLAERDKFVLILHEHNISIRQMNRLTGVSKGVISKILKHSKS